MRLNRRLSVAREKLSKDSISSTGFWENIMPFINLGMVIPIISNSFRIEQLFREEKEEAGTPTEKPQPDEEDWTAEEQLSKEWAEFIEYPMQDVHNLARIAQYFLVEQKDPIQARAKYIEFLKALLLTLTQDDKDYGSLVREFKTQTQELRFSEIVRQLDYPRFPPDTEDPFRLLARLPLPIYITTSYYDFMERALDAEGKSPQTQVCLWNSTGSAIKVSAPA